MNSLYPKPKALSDNEVQIWIVNIETLKVKQDFFYDLLNKDETRRASKFRFEKDSSTFILTRGVLKWLLGHYLNQSPNTISFEYGPFGKPYYMNQKNLNFNVSHSGSIAVIGFVRQLEFGIDVEYVKHDFDVMDIVDNYFSKKEIAALQNLPKDKQTDMFYRGWTRKEAFIKAKAKGLSFPLDAFSITMDSDKTAEVYETLWDDTEKSLWRIIPFKSAPGYKSAFAALGAIKNISFSQFQI